MAKESIRTVQRTETRTQNIAASLTHLQMIRRRLRPERVTTHDDLEALVRGTAAHMYILTKSCESGRRGNYSRLCEEVKGPSGEGVFEINGKDKGDSLGIGFGFRPKEYTKQLHYSFAVDFLPAERESGSSITRGEVFAIMPHGLEGPDGKRLGQVIILNSEFPVDDRQVKPTAYLYLLALGDFLSLPQLQHN